MLRVDARSTIGTGGDDWAEQDCDGDGRAHCVRAGGVGSCKATAAAEAALHVGPGGGANADAVAIACKPSPPPPLTWLE